MIDYQRAKEYFKSQGCELLSPIVYRANIRVRYRCKCGKEGLISWNNFSRGRRCYSCGLAARSAKRRTPWSAIVERFSKLGFTLVSKPSDYRNGYTRLMYKCKRNHLTSGMWTNIQQGEGCKLCSNLDMRGAKNPRYRHDLSIEERLSSKRNSLTHITWSRDVYSRDSYSCLSCGSNKQLRAHHLNSWNKFPLERFNVSNGITLCHDCHKNFHATYGVGNNTVAQFLEWLSRQPAGQPHGV